LRDDWPFLRDVTTSYVRLINDREWLASSPAQWGSHGVTHDQITDEIQGYAAMRNAARVVGDAEAEDFFTYLHARATVPYVVRFAPGMREWLVSRGVPLKEDEPPTGIGEYDWYAAEGEDVWCRMRTSKFMKEGYWDSNVGRRYGDGLLLDCGGNATCIANLVHYAHEAARTYALDWFEKWNGPEWYGWKSGDLWVYPTVFRTTPGQKMRKDAYETSRSNIARQLLLRMHLGWSAERIWDAFAASFHPDELAETAKDAFGPVSYFRALAAYAKLPCWLANWTPSVLTRAVYDAKASELTLVLQSPRTPTVILLNVRQLPKGVTVNGKALADGGMRKPAQLPGYMRISIPAEGEMTVVVEF
jgi:hypothetical protein